MKNLLYLLIVLPLIFGCGAEDDESFADPIDTFREGIKGKLDDQLKRVNNNKNSNTSSKSENSNSTKPKQINSKPKKTYPTKFFDCDELIEFARYKRIETLNEEWSDKGILGKPYGGIGNTSCTVTWNNVTLKGKPVEIKYNCGVDIGYSGEISIKEWTCDFVGVYCDDY